MEKTEQLAAGYRHEADEAHRAQERTQRAIYRTETLRLLVFAAGVAGAIIFRHEAWYVPTGIIAAALVPFMCLVKHHNRLYKRKDYLETKRRINEEELAALTDYDTSAFDDGSRYADPSHLYAFDLDVFGPHSLFQYINRTCTPIGGERLAAWLGHHLESKEEIEQRQAAVAELAGKREFRHEFRIAGLLYKGEATDKDTLCTWAASPSVFHSRRSTRLLPATVTGANALCLVLTLCGLMPANVWGMVWALFLTISFCFTGRISKVQATYGKQLRILGTYARLLRLTDAEDMQSPLLQEVKGRIGNERDRASEAIRQLSKLMDSLDQRNNYLMYVLLNGTFCWELWQIMRIEAWREYHAGCLPQWLEAVADTDALCSLGTFAYNHPTYAYPTLLPPEENGFCYRAEALGHPLMRRDRCVRNDMQMEGRPAFIIITGANMAGKSTYLRTVGVNFLLACCGMPVCAKRMELTPVRLVTSLRTSDSLNDNESYFFAELKRLKLIIDKLQAGEQLFIILDEILKGTNSLDKQKGSFALIEQFMALRANGIIATHDLQLGHLADLFPGLIRNLCFEADITRDELTFSYRLRPGVAQNMNACFLMRKMGIAMTD